MSTRSALIRFHRRIFTGLRSEVRQSMGPLPASLQRYYDEYHREFFRFQSVSSLTEVMEKIRDSALVYCGDYHSLCQAQSTNLELLQEIAKTRSILLATEVVYSDSQTVLDRYLNGQIDEERFLNAIQYNRTFGFDWQNYKPIFEFARENAIPVVAIDHRKENHETTLNARDRAIAKILARAHQEQPDRLIWVMIGDLHLAQSHLPRFVEKELEKSSGKKFLILHQNNERLFWKVIRKVFRGNVDVIKVSDRVYCIFNTAPWIQLRSYCSWFDDEQSDVAHDEFMLLVTSLCEFLNIDPEPILDFDVYTGDDPALLNEFAPRSDLHRYCRQQLKKKRAFMIPSKKIVYLPGSDFDLKAEMAARYLHMMCSGYRPWVGRWKEEFFRRISHIALGFLGSKILNHHRPVVPTACEELAAACYSSNACDHFGTLLGNKIYGQMLSERIQIKEVRHFYFEPFEQAGSGEKFYARFCEQRKESAGEKR